MLASEFSVCVYLDFHPTLSVGSTAGREDPGGVSGSRLTALCPNLTLLSWNPIGSPPVGRKSVFGEWLPMKNPTPTFLRGSVSPSLMSSGP